MINNIFNSGVCPEHFKKAEIVPIYKNNNKKDMNNYRPISLISNITKIFERVLYNRISKFIEKNNLLSDSQYGFRKNKSTADVLHEFTKFIYERLDNRKPVLAIFLDLSKAFDTINHNKLTQKLYNMGIRGLRLNLIESYLNERKQVVKIDESKNWYSSRNNYRISIIYNIKIKKNIYIRGVILQLVGVNLILILIQF